MNEIIWLIILALGLFASNNVRKQLKSTVTTAVTVAFGLLLVASLAISSFTSIEEGQEGVILTFNKAADEPLKPGLRFTLPWQTVEKVSVLDEKFEMDLECFSKDLQGVLFQVTTTWRPRLGSSPAIWREFGHDARTISVEPEVMEAVKAGTARYDATSAVTKHVELQASILAALREQMARQNIEIIEMSFSGPAFSPKFQAAINEKQAAYEKANKALNELTEARTRAHIAIADASGEAMAAIEDGKGQAAALKSNAEAEAFQTIALAKATATQIRQTGLSEAQRIATLGSALRSNPAAVTLEVLKKWKGKVPNTMLGNTGAGQILLQTTAPTSEDKR
jgi:membrane protease subunit HflK